MDSPPPPPPPPPSDQDPDWASLPINVLDTILDKLVPLSDYINFSEVNKPWNSVATHQKEQRIVSSSKKGLPHLLTPNPPSTGRVLPYRRTLCGSSHGWVATVDQDLAITLSKPFSPKSQPITLPPVGDREVFGVPFWYDYMIKKVVLSDDPDLFPGRYRVVVIFGLFRSLAVIGSGEKEWTFCTNDYSNDDPFLFSDVIFYKSKLFASETKMSCGLVSFELDRPGSNLDRLSSNLGRLDPVQVVKNRFVDESDLRHKTYLVESSTGDLLLVERFLATQESESEGEERMMRPMTVYFKVSKLSEDMFEWLELDGIGDEVLFLGDNESMCLSSLDYGVRWMKNCICFGDDQTDVPLYTPQRDMGVYCFEDESLEKLDDRQDDMAPCLWVLRKLRRQ